MKKLMKKGGFSLIEMMCALLIMVLLIMAIDVGLKAGGTIYQDATFEAESGTLAGILNTSLGDILRYSIDVRETTATEREKYGNDVGIPEAGGTGKYYVFTSLDYGIQDAYFYVPFHENGTNMGVLQMKNTRNPNVVELVNTGAYPNLVVSDFHITYSPRETEENEDLNNVNDIDVVQGGYFEISYQIISELDSSKTRMVETIVRVMNDNT